MGDLAESRETGVDRGQRGLRVEGESRGGEGRQREGRVAPSQQLPEEEALMLQVLDQMEGGKPGGLGKGSSKVNSQSQQAQGAAGNKSLDEEELLIFALEQLERQSLESGGVEKGVKQQRQQQAGRQKQQQQKQQGARAQHNGGRSASSRGEQKNRGAKGSR